VATLPGANQRPIVVRRVKKYAAGHHGGAWKVAYADFVTAMMAFFMLLWLISNPDKQRLKGLAEYFSPTTATALSQTTEMSSSTSGVGGMPGAGGRTRRAQSDDAGKPSGQPTMQSGTAGSATGGTARVPDAAMRVLAQEMTVAIDSLPPDTDGNRGAKSESDRDGLRISLFDTSRRSMFRDGTAVLNPFAREMLARVAAKLAKSDVQVAIEGHTASDAGSVAGTGTGGWRLSGERALAAREAMIAAGLPAGRFAEVVALADTRPVYPDQPERAENRRITVVAKGGTPVLPTDASFRF